MVGLGYEELSQDHKGTIDLYKLREQTLLDSEGQGRPSERSSSASSSSANSLLALTFARSPASLDPTAGIMSPNPNPHQPSPMASLILSQSQSLMGDSSSESRTASLISETTAQKRLIERGTPWVAFFTHPAALTLLANNFMYVSIKGTIRQKLEVDQLKVEA